MATTVMGTKPGDFVKDEYNPYYSREVKTALSGQTIKAGQVCASNSDGKKLVVSATGNETHTYTPTGTATGGTYTLHLWHSGGYWVDTAAIAYNADNSAIDAAIEAVLGSTSVTVAAGQLSVPTAITIQFSGTGYAGLTHPLGYANIENLVGTTALTPTRSTAAGTVRNEVQTIIFGADATGGTFKMGITIPAGSTGAGSVVWTDTMAWNATDATFLAAINAALDDALGASKIVATARSGVDTDLGCVLTFSGTGYAGLAHALVMLDTSALTSVTTATVTRTTAGGYAGERIDNKADCIAMEDIDASLADKTGVFLVRGPAIVDADRIIYGGGYPASVITALKAVGIVAVSEGTLRSVQTM